MTGSLTESREWNKQLNKDEISFAVFLRKTEWWSKLIGTIFAHHHQDYLHTKSAEEVWYRSGPVCKEISAWEHKFPGGNKKKNIGNQRCYTAPHKSSKQYIKLIQVLWLDLIIAVLHGAL